MFKCCIVKNKMTIKDMQNYTKQNEKIIPYQNSFQYYNVELKCSIVMNRTENRYRTAGTIPRIQCANEIHNFTKTAYPSRATRITPVLLIFATFCFALFYSLLLVFSGGVFILLHHGIHFKHNKIVES